MKCCLCGISLVLPDAIAVMGDLALQVAEVDVVVIADGDLAYAAAGEVDRGG